MWASRSASGKVRLKVRDFNAVSAFYQSVLGLNVSQTDDSRVTLGTRATVAGQVRDWLDRAAERVMDRLGSGVYDNGRVVLKSSC